MKHAIVLLLLLTTASSLAHEPVADAAAATRQFLASLDKEQRQACQLDWGDDNRTKWNFLPDRFLRPLKRRIGLRWDKMRTDQQMLAQSVLTSGLSSHGHRQAMAIVALEQVLHELENGSPMRDPNHFYLAVFGKPTADGTWAWRFEGHHLSINVSFVKGKRVAVTPTFFGANPAKTTPEHLAAAEPLAAEQAIARQLVTSLTEAQLAAARFATNAPRDILTRAKRTVGRNDEDWFNSGIPASQLTPPQRQLLDRLLRAYTSRYRPELLAKLAEGTPVVTDDTRFAWAGGLEPGEGHYYRIVTRRYLIEYDNVQNSANHVHTTWRDFDGDFGADLLKQHYEQHHHQPPAK